MFTAALRYAEFAGATESGRCGSVDSYEGSGADMRVTRTVFFAERCTRNERMARPESPMKLNFPSGCKWSGGLSLPGCAQDILAKKKKRIGIRAAQRRRKRGRVGEMMQEGIKLVLPSCCSAGCWPQVNQAPQWLVGYLTRLSPPLARGRPQVSPSPVSPAHVQPEP